MLPPNTMCMIHTPCALYPQFTLCIYLFYPRFFVPIPSALYHTAKNWVNISLISNRFSIRVILLKNGVISVKTGWYQWKRVDISENGLISVRRRMISPRPPGCRDQSKSSISYLGRVARRCHVALPCNRCLFWSCLQLFPVCFFDIFANISCIWAIYKMELSKIYHKLSHHHKMKLGWNKSSTDLWLVWPTLSTWLYQSRAYASLRPLTGTTRVIMLVIQILGKYYLYIYPHICISVYLAI